MSRRRRRRGDGDGDDPGGGRSTANVDDGDGDDSADEGSRSEEGRSPELNRLLERLRPFQREAFDFATGGGKGGGGTPRNPPTKHSRGDKGRGRPRTDDDDRPPAVAGGGGGRILLADEMGLGKTVTSLAIMMHYASEWPLLILCPASLRHAWPSEIEKFLPSLPTQAVYVVSGFDDADFYCNPRKRDRIKIVVATYSLLQTRSASARVLDQFDFRCVIADESHNLRDKNSQRCKLALPLLKKAKRLILLSGTPALARPVELWAQLHCLDADAFGSYTFYTKKFCNARRGRFGWDVSGSSNAEELHGLMRRVMIRRLKSDVLHELPAKQRSIVPVKIYRDRLQRCREVMEDLREARVDASELLGGDAASAHFDARRLLMEAYRASGIGKAKATSEYLLDWLAGSGTQKILVFAHHQQVLDALENAVSKKHKGVTHVRIDGSVPPAERAVRVRKFQSHRNVRVALLSVTAAGVGLTLTAASTVLFAELHWTPGVLAQAEDRCHRIGQRNAVNVLYCVCKDREVSVDLSLWNMLGRKVGNLGLIVDGDKSASMNAREEADDGSAGRRPGRSGGGGGASAEDELTSFFAETSPTDENATTHGPKTPVKGSIQSFFARMKSPPPPPSGRATAAPTTPPNEMGATSSSAAAAAVLRSRTVTPPRGGVGASSSAWACAACTYVNAEPPLRSSPSTTARKRRCKMCGTARGDGAAADEEERPEIKGGPLVDIEADHRSLCVSPSRPDDGGGAASPDVVAGGSIEEVRSSSRDVVELDDDSSSSSDEDVLSLLPSVVTKKKKRGVASPGDVEAFGEESIDDRAGGHREVVEIRDDDDESSASSFDGGGADPSSDDSSSSSSSSDEEVISLLRCVEPSAGSAPPSPTGERPEADDVVRAGEDDRSVPIVRGSKRPSVFASVRKEESSSVATDRLRSSDDRRRPALSFSVSRNSGRVSVHSTTTGEPLVNFDVEHVVSDGTSDLLLERKVKRGGGKNWNLPPNAVRFDDDAVREVVGSIDKNVMYNAKALCNIETGCNQLKSFVSSYLSLREVEKKHLMEWGKPVLPTSLRQTLAKIMTSVTTESTSSDRYSGGAKERAVENKNNGCASQIDEDVIGGRACAWCAEPLSAASLAGGVESTYCSQKCAEEGRLRRGGMYASSRVRSQVFALEGGVCQICGVDTYALYRRINALEPPERLSVLCDANWKLPRGRSALDGILQNPRECDFWQADHIVPVAEGGGSCGLENLRTLCTPCHQVETEKLRARMRLDGGSLDVARKRKRGQLDIRSAFGAADESSLPWLTRKKRGRPAD